MRWGEGLSSTECLPGLPGARPLQRLRVQEGRKLEVQGLVGETDNNENLVWGWRAGAQSQTWGSESLTRSYRLGGLE